MELKQEKQEKQEKQDFDEDAVKKERKVSNAQVHVSPILSATLAINKLHGDTLDIVTMGLEIAECARKVSAGNLQEVELMLMTQAKTLDYLFYETISKLGNLENINQMQVFSDIALKAQNQSRKALTALTEIKHPKRSATFIKQQNNAVNQQVNIANSPGKKKSQKKEKLANELLEEKENEQWMDARTTTSPITDDSGMAAMETCRRKDRSRKKYQQNECV